MLNKKENVADLVTQIQKFLETATASMSLGPLILKNSDGKMHIFEICVLPSVPYAHQLLKGEQI